MVLRVAGDYFICGCSYDERHIPQNAKFIFNGYFKKWATESAKKAYQLINYAEPDAVKKILLDLGLSKDSFRPSPPLTENYDFTPMPHQISALSFALKTKNSYLALAPGLGKTFTGVMAVNSLEDAYQSFLGYRVIVCPPFLAATWSTHFKLAGLPEPRVIKKRKDSLSINGPEVIILPDSLLIDEGIQDELRKLPIDLLIVDEAHRFKNESAKRTKALCGGRLPKKVLKKLNPERVILLSGSPFLNRPMDIYPLANAFAPHAVNFLSKHDFGLKYCGGYYNDHGWDYSGASNLGELNKILTSNYPPFMLIQHKDILDLPKKTYQLVIMDKAEGSSASNKLEATSLAKVRLDEILEDPSSAFLKLAELRHHLGLEKINFAAEYILDAVESGDDLVVFGWHKAVISGVSAKLKDAGLPHLVITGDTPKEKRAEIEKTFQTTGVKILLCNIEAAGVGFTFTKASRCVFIEASWVPSINEQAIDRLHRIGQTKSVSAEFIVKDGSLDYLVLSKHIYKLKNINQIMGVK